MSPQTRSSKVDESEFLTNQEFVDHMIEIWDKADRSEYIRLDTASNQRSRAELKAEISLENPFFKSLFTTRVAHLRSERDRIDRERGVAPL